MSTESTPLGSRHPSLHALIVRIEALRDIDPLMFYEWARPRIETLRVQYYASGLPATEFGMWARERFLDRVVPA